MQAHLFGINMLCEAVKRLFMRLIPMSLES